MSRRSEAAAYWERSDHALEWARKFIGLGEHTKSVQDSYLAAFCAAKAALAQLNIRSKYHTSVMNRVTALVRDGPLASGTDDTLASQNDPMVLRMIDWRGCSAVEYVPGRVGSHPSFIGRRIAVQGLVDWIEGGRWWEGFAEAFRIEADAVREAVC